MHLIGDRLTVTGMRLAGLREVHVADKGNAASVLVEASGDAKVLLITKTLADVSRREIEKLRKAGKVVVEVPDRSGPGEDFVSKMVKEVIGFEIKK